MILYQENGWTIEKKKAAPFANLNYIFYHGDNDGDNPLCGFGESYKDCKEWMALMSDVVSSCCGVVAGDYEDVGICPECKEHCDFN